MEMEMEFVLAGCGSAGCGSAGCGSAGCGSAGCGSVLDMDEEVPVMDGCDDVAVGWVLMSNN